MRLRRDALTSSAGIRQACMHPRRAPRCEPAHRCRSVMSSRLGFRRLGFRRLGFRRQRRFERHPQLRGNTDEPHPRQLPGAYMAEGWNLLEPTLALQRGDAIAANTYMHACKWRTFSDVGAGVGVRTCFTRRDHRTWRRHAVAERIVGCECDTQALDAGPGHAVQGRRICVHDLPIARVDHDAALHNVDTVVEMERAQNYVLVDRVDD
eukprot:101014-Pleurochrysis_carterae.AAC.5